MLKDYTRMKPLETNSRMNDRSTSFQVEGESRPSADWQVRQAHVRQHWLNMPGCVARVDRSRGMRRRIDLKYGGRVRNVASRDIQQHA